MVNRSLSTDKGLTSFSCKLGGSNIPGATLHCTWVNTTSGHLSRTKKICPGSEGVDPSSNETVTDVPES